MLPLAPLHAAKLDRSVALANRLIQGLIPTHSCVVNIAKPLCPVLPLTPFHAAKLDRSVALDRSIHASLSTHSFVVRFAKPLGIILPLAPLHAAKLDRYLTPANRLIQGLTPTHSCVVRFAKPLGVMLPLAPRHAAKPLALCHTSLPARKSPAPGGRGAGQERGMEVTVDPPGNHSTRDWVYPRVGGGISRRTWAVPRLVLIRSPCIRVSSRQVLSRSTGDRDSVRRSLSSAILLSSMVAWAESLISIVALVKGSPPVQSKSPSEPAQFGSKGRERTMACPTKNILAAKRARLGGLRNTRSLLVFQEAPRLIVSVNADSMAGTVPERPCHTHNPTKLGWPLTTVKGCSFVLFLVALFWYPCRFP